MLQGSNLPRSTPGRSKAQAVQLRQKGSASALAEALEGAFGDTSLSVLDRCVRDGEYISAQIVAAAIEANPGKVLPDSLRDYLCRFLRGEVKRPRGRKKSESPLLTLKTIMARLTY